MTRAAALKLATLVAACALADATAASTPKVVRFERAEDVASISAKERTLWQLSDEADASIARAGVGYGDAELDAYMQRIVDRLYPEFPGLIRARVFKSTQVNAFMQPNGSTYMFLGMLNFCDNEAQLAAILAHEGGHFVDRHSWRGYKSASSMAVFGQLVSLGGIPIAGELIAASSIMGYSRELESTADAIALERMQRAGYDVREAKRPFERLVAYLKANDAKEPFFFADHPKLQQRVDFFVAHEGAQDPARAETGAEAYLKATEKARLTAIEEDSKRRNYRTLIHILSDEERAAILPPQSAYYLGVAYRQRNLKGDPALAEASFERARVALPGFAPSYKALGELRMKDPARAAEARELFTEYLRLAPDAPDRGYVQSYLTRLTPPAGAN